MATALSYPTISGVSTPPYLSALSETANIQNTINFLYYGSADSGTTPRTSLSTSSGIYGMLSQLQTQISAVQSGVNVHESAKWATTTTLAAVYAAGSSDASGGTGIGATITFSSTGVQKIDSTTVDLALNDRVLVKNGTTALSGTSSTANGIYYVSTAPAIGVAGILTRALDSDNSIAGEMAEGDFLYVANGDTNANEGFILTSSSTTGTGPAGSIRIGTDGVTYTQFIGVGSYYVGTTSAQISSANQALTGISSLAMPGATSGTITLTPTAVAGTTALTIPARNGETLATTALAGGGTNASLTASNGGIVYSTASAMAILASTATAGQHLQSGASSAPSWTTATFPSTATGTGTILRANGTNWLASTATYPNTVATTGTILRASAADVWTPTTSTFADTYAVNTLLYAGTANVVTGLATANSGVLVTSASGVPSISTTIPTVTLTTPTVDTVNTSLTTSGTAALWNTGLTTGTISIGGALTSGTVNIAATAVGTKTINIGTSTGSTTINGTVINSGDGVILKTASFTVGAGERNYNVTGTASVTVT
jgi:hypothetical protein